MKHNNQIPNGHFHKKWQLRVKTWFDQPGNKKRRRLNRTKKAALVSPRPMEKLRPAIRCPTIRYNRKLRAGRGFTLEELKAVGLYAKLARTIGIAVDHRRRNRSVESLELNVQRLKEYQSKLVLFPKNPKAPKKGDSSPEECAVAQQFKGEILPIAQIPKTACEAPRAVTEKEKSFAAFATLQRARLTSRYAGIRKKRAQLKEEEEAIKKK